MTQTSKIKKYALILLPFIVAILIMLPRLMSPQFGFFDDARMLSQSQKFLRGDFSMSHDIQAGRFRPVYWLYYTLIFSAAGYRPFWFFFGNLLLLLILLIEIRLILKSIGATGFQVLISSLAFVLSMPIIENFYTLSKGEPLQLVLILAAIIAFQDFNSQKQKLKTWVTGLFVTIFILFAIMVKETTLVMLPIAILWLAYPLLLKRKNRQRELKKHLIFFLSITFAILIFFILRSVWGSPSLLGGTYTDRYLVEIDALARKFLRWTTQYAFYFHYLIPITVLIVLLFVLRIPFSDTEIFVFYRWGIWILLWVGVLIPWEYAELYYLLPFAFGGSLIIGLIAPKVIEATKRLVGYRRYSLVALSGISTILFFLTLPNYLTDAKTQMTFDQVNQKMVAQAVNLLPKDSSVYINIETSNEYSEKLELLFREHYQMDKIYYSNITAQILNDISEKSGAFVLMPFIDNQPRLTVRAGVEEEYQKRWNEKLLKEISNNSVRREHLSASFKITNVNLPILTCPILGDLGFCAAPDPIIDNRLFTYGWDIYEIK